MERNGTLTLGGMSGRRSSAGTCASSHALFASRSTAMMAPISPAPPSSRDFWRAASPWPCSALMVSAVAVPVGNGSCSMLMSWRLMGMAAKTPSAAMTAEPHHQPPRAGQRAGEHQQRGHGGHVAAARHVARRGRHGAHGVVLQRGELLP